MNAITQKMLQTYYPDQTHPFDKLLAQMIPTGGYVLDAGCGDGSIFKYNIKDQVNLLVGLDLRRDIGKNQQIHCATNGSIEYLPFANNTFDLIFSRFVLEHLKNPKFAFGELARILRPGGALLFLVPNARHYFPLAGRIIPHRLQQYIAGWVGYKEKDTFPTYYQANTGKKLKDLAMQTGLRVQLLNWREPSPWFLSFSPLTLAMGIVYERLVNSYEFFAPLRAHIMAICYKP